MATIYITAPRPKVEKRQDNGGSNTGRLARLNAAINSAQNRHAYMLQQQSAQAFRDQENTLIPPAPPPPSDHRVTARNRCPRLEGLGQSMTATDLPLASRFRRERGRDLETPERNHDSIRDSRPGVEFWANIPAPADYHTVSRQDPNSASSVCSYYAYRRRCSRLYRCSRATPES